MNYSKEFSEDSLFQKIIKTTKKAGISVIYAVLLLFYTLQKSSTPKKAKATIMGALGYFISPIDAIIDITPVAGYTDDLGVLIAAIITVAMYIDDEVKQKARTKLNDWFGNYDENLLKDIDSKVNKSE
ncbi:hypothetical protein DUF1312 [Gottschalkia acidurici 9a]|uniref:DUF1232 domain-containing protein n=1 Tax=Gottschalkia acidurici (strain ATCC 7906 / DSM 604 / BCRC 14475 / CIP 104303 / KCTC 5404 / NCIMB 10678 / 9a) TaxID=1128398 RepID=K0AYW6_GOTA9|nr:DUF1232 domain-containing protein [Gottschalkia acidurici]AFS77982.1 hypothetical protein DUF1312 [Gottschalkia acidurici 9a]